MSEKLRVGILGATGMVGQRFISLLENHPWIDSVTKDITINQSAGSKSYGSWSSWSVYCNASSYTVAASDRKSTRLNSSH